LKNGNIVVADTANSCIRHIAVFQAALSACDSAWHHVALVYSPSGSPYTLSAFLDGALILSSAITVTLPVAASSVLNVGWSGDLTSNGGSPFSGAMSDLRLYSRVLDPAEIAMLATAASPSLAAGQLPSCSPTPMLTLSQTLQDLRQWIPQGDAFVASATSALLTQVSHNGGQPGAIWRLAQINVASSFSVTATMAVSSLLGDSAAANWAIAFQTVGSDAAVTGIDWGCGSCMAGPLVTAVFHYYGSTSSSGGWAASIVLSASAVQYSANQGIVFISDGQTDPLSSSITVTLAYDAAVSTLVLTSSLSTRNVSATG